MRKQLNNFFNLSLVNVFVRLTGLLVFPLIAKRFSIEIFAMYVLAQTVWNYFATFSDMGVKPVAIRDLNILQTDDKKKIFIENVFSLRSITCFSSVVLMNIFSLILFPDFETRSLVFLFSFSILPLAFDMTWIFDAKQDMSKQIQYRVIERITFLVIVIFGALNNNIFLVAIAGLFSNFFGICWILINNKELIKYFRVFRGKLQLKIFKEAFVLGVSSLLAPILLSIDLFFVNHFLGKEAVGIYGGYEKIVLVVISFGWSFASAFYPEISRLYGLKEFDKLKHLFIKCTVLLTIMFGTGYFFFNLLAKKIILLLFTPAFLSHINVLKVLMLMGLPALLNTLYLISLNAFSLAKERLLIVILGLFVNIIFCFIFVPKYGLMGAAFVTLSVQLILVFSAVKLLARKLLVCSRTV